MADINDDDLKHRLAALTITGAQADAVLKAVTESLKKSKKLYDSFNSAMEQAEKAVKLNRQSLGNFTKELLGGRSRVKDLTYAISNLDDTIEAANSGLEKLTEGEKEALKIQRQALVQQHLYNKGIETTVKGLRDLSGVAIKGFTAATLGAAKSALNGSDALSVAQGMMTANIDMANGATQAGATALKDMGSAAMFGSGKMKAVGVIAIGLGTALSFLGNEISELAKAGIGFMIDQTRKNIAGFQAMSSVGALYTDGMQGMITQASKGGLTLEQLSTAAKNNTESFTQTGLGMGEATRRMTNAMNIGGTRARDAMFGLGMTMEEQADAYATVMAQLSGPNKELHASDKEIADTTMQYVKDLKTLQAITGEDVKSKQEKIRQENDTLKFQQILSRMQPEKAQALQAAMNNMTESQRQTLRENLIYGNVVSANLAISQQANRGIAQSNREFLQAVRDGTISQEKVRDIQARTADLTYDDAMKARGLALSTNAVVQQSAKETLEEANYKKKMKGKTAAEQQVEERTKPGAAVSYEVTTQQKIQQFATDMQNLANNNFVAFGKAIDQMTTTLGKSVQELAALGVGAAVMPPWVSGLVTLGSSILMAIPALILSMKGGLGGLFGGGSKIAGAVGGAAATTGIKGLATGAGKSIGKMIPGLGFVIGASDAINRAIKGDYVGAGIAGIGAAASFVPGYGTAVTAVTEAGLIARDMINQRGNEKTPGATKLSDLIKFSARTGDEAHFKQLQPQVQQAFVTMAQEYLSRTGQKLELSSGFRSAEEQADLIRSGRGGSNPVAQPGHSFHQLGKALDVNSRQVAELKNTGMLTKYGFSPMDRDPPHIQMLDKGGVIEGAETAIVGENGPEIVHGGSVTSTASTSKIFDQMNIHLAELVRLTKTQNNTSEKILRVSA